MIYWYIAIASVIIFLPLAAVIGWQWLVGDCSEDDWETIFWVSLSAVFVSAGAAILWPLGWAFVIVVMMFWCFKNKREKNQQ